MPNHTNRVFALALAVLVLEWPSRIAAQNVEIATTVAFTEGPTAAPDGSVYFTDIIAQRIMRLGADGVLSVFREQSNVANGLLIDPQVASSPARAQSSPVPAPGSFAATTSNRMAP